MKTDHKIYYKDAKQLEKIQSQTIDLMVTSPPYPMIEMWDDIFCQQNSKIKSSLSRHDGPKTFELMHQELDKVWKEIFRVLKFGGIAAINIGDATRTIKDRFALYTNHARIQAYMLELGFSSLPIILWRKQTNAPNKFMGSGMLPPGAYVTLEHEYVLIFRKGDKRAFISEREKQRRRESAYFWEERNIWFSDVWMDLKGTTQKMADSKTRTRSGAFPFELAYRLISMFSIKEDTVLDPFFGTGTTMLAAMASGRNSIGYEIDQKLRTVVNGQVDNVVSLANSRIEERLKKHLEFVENRYKSKGKFKHQNENYLFPVITGQEKSLLINALQTVKKKAGNGFEVTYFDEAQEDFVESLDGYVMDEQEKKIKKPKKLKKPKTVPKSITKYRKLLE